MSTLFGGTTTLVPLVDLMTNEITWYIITLEWQHPPFFCSYYPIYIFMMLYFCCYQMILPIAILVVVFQMPSRYSQMIMLPTNLVHVLRLAHQSSGLSRVQSHSRNQNMNTAGRDCLYMGSKCNHTFTFLHTWTWEIDYLLFIIIYCLFLTSIYTTYYCML